MKLLATAVALAGLAAAAPASAAVIASSSFTTSAEGWGVGEFTAIGPTSGLIYDAVNGRIASPDVAGNSSFLASAAYLGDKSAAFGGTLRFDLSAQTTDNSPYSAVSLIGGGLTLYSVFTQLPGTALTPFSFDLVGASFKLDNPFGAGGTLATDAQLQQVLGDVQQLAILVDWQSGADFVQLDNVVLADAIPGGIVPEPATWALLIGGIGATGATLRRRRAVTIRYA